MASYNPPLKNSEYIFYVSLVSQTDTKIFQANPTLAAGDVKVAIDDGAPANLTTLPAVDADFTKRVKVTLSGSEMNGDNISVIFSDASGAEWCDLTVNLQTVAVQFDGMADAILDEAISEPGGVFAWGSATLRNVVAWLGALSRNRMVQTVTTTTLRNDANDANLATSAIEDDGTTFTRDEWV